MSNNFNQYFTLLVFAMVFIAGLSALVAGIRRKPSPFFWLKEYKAIYLKTPAHYILFGLGSMLAAVFFAYRPLVAMGLF